MTTKLSTAQRKMLDRLVATEGKGERTPMTGNADSGRTCSAWYRTLRSLEKLNFATSVREGDAYRARVTWKALREVYGIRRCAASFTSGKQCKRRTDGDSSWCAKHQWVGRAIVSMNRAAIEADRKSQREDSNDD